MTGTIILAPNSGPAGTRVTVTGVKFPPHTQVDVVIGSTVLASVLSDQHGAMQASIVMPGSPAKVIVRTAVAQQAAAAFNVTPIVPPPPPPPPVHQYLIDDDFDGPAGSQPDPNVWVVHPSVRYNAEDGLWAGPKAENVFLDGDSNLILRIQREEAPYLGQGPYSGAWVDTFGHGDPTKPWPIPLDDMKVGLTVPFHVEMRALLTPTPGAWDALWTVGVSSPGDVPEIDIAEVPMSTPTLITTHQHLWGSSDLQTFNGGLMVSDASKNWHVYSADVKTDQVDFFVDGQSAGVGYGEPVLTHGLILDATLGAPGSWGSGGKEPDPSDPGPWLMKVDWLRAWAL